MGRPSQPAIAPLQCARAQLAPLSLSAATGALSLTATRSNLLTSSSPLHNGTALKPLARFLSLVSTGQVVAERTLVKLTRCFGSGYPRGVCHATVLRSLAYSLTERPHVEHELLEYPHNYERRIVEPSSGIRCSVSAR